MFTPAPTAVAAIDLNDCRFQVREQLDKDALARYQDIIAARGMEGFDCKPILWEIPGTKKVAILDGFHRIQAAVNVGQAEVPAITLTGMSQADATILAIQANLANGVQLKAEERMEACRRIIEALTEKKDVNSNAHVAELMGVSEGTIRMYREKLIAAGKLTAADKVTGKDGKQQAAKKKRSASVVTKNTNMAPGSTKRVKAENSYTSNAGQQQAEALVSTLVNEDASTDSSREDEWLGHLEYACETACLLAGLNWAGVNEHEAFAEALADLQQACAEALKVRPHSSGSKAA